MKALIEKVSDINSFGERYREEREINSLDDLKKIQLEHGERLIIAFKDEKDDSIIQDFLSDFEFDIQIYIYDGYFE